MSTNPRPLWQCLVAAIVPMALFVGSSHGFIFQSNGMNEFAPHLCNEMVPEVTMEECIGLKESVNDETLDYVTQCDDWTEGVDERWTPVAAKAHAISRSKRFDPNKKEFTQGRHLCLKTELVDGSTTWLQEEAVRAQVPRVAAQCVIDMKPFEHPDFNWVKKHFNWGASEVRKARSFAAQSKSDQRVKFGTQVPRSQKNVLQLDEINRDHEV